MHPATAIVLSLRMANATVLLRQLLMEEPKFLSFAHPRIHDFSLTPPSFLHLAKSSLVFLISRNPGRSSNTAKGLPPPTPTAVISRASLLRSKLPAHTLHCMGFRSGLLSTTPTQSRSTEKIVSSTMSVGIEILGSSALGSIELGAGGMDEDGRRECSYELYTLCRC